MISNYLLDLKYFTPELVACTTMVLLILIESFYRNKSSDRYIVYAVAFAGLAICLIEIRKFYLISDSILGVPSSIFYNAIVVDSFGLLFKGLLVCGTLGSIILAKLSKEIDVYVKSEFAILAIGVLIGGMLLVSANNMLIMYIGIETISILSYAMASLKKNDELSAEAGVKYTLYGGVSTGIMLFGMSHIYGIVGSIQFDEISRHLSMLDTKQLIVFVPSFLLLFVGIGYKIACVPFHMWAPDVYEGSPTPVTTFFSIVPKLAGLGLLIRITMLFFGTQGFLQDSWIGTLQIIAALTMTVGNITAINQRSIKRMLAYSSIGHVGMMLLGVVTLDNQGIQSILFYGTIYLFMTLVAFYITSFIYDQYGNDHFERFKGLIFRYPLMAILMTIVMLSLAGVPPFGGFVAKFNILLVIIKKSYYELAVVAIINSVISLFYYLKVVRLMIFGELESTEEISGFSLRNRVFIFTLTVPIIYFGIYWSNLMYWLGSARLYIQ